MTATKPSMTTLRAPYIVRLAQTLPMPVQETATALLQQLPAEYIAQILFTQVQFAQENTAESAPIMGEPIFIKNMVDGRGLACPMPLLKTKVALRDVNSGESLYVVATDPNSQADILAFCQQTQQSCAPTLTLTLNQMTPGLSVDGTAAGTPDTIFHFIITKTDTN